MSDSDGGAVEGDESSIEAAMKSGRTSSTAHRKPVVDTVSEAIQHFAERARGGERGPRVLSDGQCNILWQSAEGERRLEPPLPLWLKSGRLQARHGSGEKAWPTFVENVGEEGERLLLTGSEPDAWVLLRGWSHRLGEQRVVFLKCSPSCPLGDVTSSGLA